ncbi:hypothetical protein RHGRI_003294 [Rhododendron griersonianum]|uniref:Uncharacterized protein n=1 Tax=Rhododendron griersonianum TaxID=479676 RepID=A0AAV6L7N4_9ERIC|nr:hypothetical protein RHGRI_003294 [Rhododendron griersonianum]
MAGGQPTLLCLCGRQYSAVVHYCFPLRVPVRVLWSDALVVLMDIRTVRRDSRERGSHTTTTTTGDDASHLHRRPRDHAYHLHQRPRFPPPPPEPNHSATHRQRLPPPLASGKSDVVTPPRSGSGPQPHLSCCRRSGPSGPQPQAFSLVIAVLLTVTAGLQSKFLRFRMHFTADSESYVLGEIPSQQDRITIVRQLWDLTQDVLKRRKSKAAIDDTSKDLMTLKSGAFVVAPILVEDICCQMKIPKSETWELGITKELVTDHLEEADKERTDNVLGSNHHLP